MARERRDLAEDGCTGNSWGAAGKKEVFQVVTKLSVVYEKANLVMVKKKCPR